MCPNTMIRQPTLLMADLGSKEQKGLVQPPFNYNNKNNKDNF